MPLGCKEFPQCIVCFFQNSGLSSSLRALVAWLILVIGKICVFRGWLAERRARFQTFIPPPQLIPYQAFVYPAEGTPALVYPAQESLGTPSLPDKTPTDA